MNAGMQAALDVLRNGGVIAYPTDTTCGIGCDISNESAVRRIFEIKGRTFNKPLSIACSSIEMLKKYVLINNTMEALLEEIYPGPVTLLLDKSGLVDDRITAGSKKVGVRIPDHKDILELIDALGKPIITTSANISGENDPVTTSEIKLQVDYILEGGCRYKKPSTIIDVESRKIIRAGVGSNKYQQIIDRLLMN